MFNENLFNITPFSGFTTEAPTPVTAVVTASETAYNMSIDYIYNGTIADNAKHMKLYRNMLDGSFLLIDPNGARGWSSATASNSQKLLTSNPTITIQFSRAFALPGLQFTFDIVNSVYPVEYEIKLYNGDSLISSELISNTSTVSSYIPQSTSYVTKATVKFVEMNDVDVPIYLNKIELASPSSFEDTGLLLADFETLVKQLYSVDIIGLIRSEELSNITVYVPANIDSYMSSSYVDEVENIHTAMNKYERQIFGKVTITYTDAFSDDSLIMTTTAGEANGTALTELTDEIEDSSQLWFSLHNNKLDGSFKVLPKFNDRRYSAGWWGTVFSDNNGVLSMPAEITANFTARTLTALSVYGLSSMSNYPVDFTIKVFIGNDIVHEEVVIGNTTVNWFTKLTPKISGVTSYILTITKISQPNTTVKLSELFTSIRETYYNDDIESISLLEEVGYTSGSLPIGNISANEIDITLSNADRRFDLNNRSSTLYGYVKRNRKVQAWLGAFVAGMLEWAPIGTFWTTQWDIPRDQMYASLVARDRLELLRLTDLSPTPVFVDTSMYDLFEYVLLDAGIGNGGYVIDDSLKDIIIPYAWFDRSSHREALQRLASCAIIQVYCDKRDVIHVHWSLDTSANYKAIFDDDINIISSNYPLAVSEQVNHIEVTYKSMSIGASEEVYNGHQGITLESGVPQTVRLVFSKTPVVSISLIEIDNQPDVTASVVNLYSWGADIELTNNSTALLVGLNINVSGSVLSNSGEKTAIAEDTILIREDGKIAQNVNHDFIQESEYAQALADQLLLIFKDSRYDVTLENRGDAAVELGDKVIINDSYDNVAVDYVMTRQSLRWDGSLSATTEGKRL